MANAQAIRELFRVVKRVERTLDDSVRRLPHSLDAEKSVLGAILMHNEAFNAAAEVIDAGDFFRDAHRRIFDRMIALNERGDAIDFVTLKEELFRHGELEEVGGPAYIASTSRLAGESERTRRVVPAAEDTQWRIDGGSLSTLHARARMGTTVGGCAVAPAISSVPNAK